MDFQKILVLYNKNIILHGKSAEYIYDDQVGVELSSDCFFS